MVKLKQVLGVMVILIILVVVSVGLVPLISHEVAASDLPLFEETRLTSSPQEEYFPDQIIVKFKETTLSKAEASLNESLGTKVIYTSRFAGFKVFQIPEGKTVTDMVAAYSEQSIVEYAEPNYVRRVTWSPNDEFYSYQWHFDQINLEAAWDLDTTAPNYGGDPSIIVAVLDTGVAYETYGGYIKAPDLANTNFWTNLGEILENRTHDDRHGHVDDAHGWGFVNNDTHRSVV